MQLQPLTEPGRRFVALAELGKPDGLQLTDGALALIQRASRKLVEDRI